MKKFFLGIVVLACAYVGAQPPLVRGVTPQIKNFEGKALAYFALTSEKFDELVASHAPMKIHYKSPAFGECFSGRERMLVFLMGTIKCVVRFEVDKSGKRVIEVYAVDDAVLDVLKEPFSSHWKELDSVVPAAVLDVGPTALARGEAVKHEAGDDDDLLAFCAASLVSSPEEGRDMVVRRPSPQPSKAAKPLTDPVVDALNKVQKEMREALGTAASLYAEKNTKFSTDGRPRSMKDAFDFMSKNGWLCFAVYDGFGSSEVAQGLAGFKENRLAAIDINLLPRLIDQTGVLSDDAIKKLFRNIDESLIPIADAASAAIICLLHPATNQACFINLGDSCAVALRDDGSVLEQTLEHLPFCEDACSCGKDMDGTCACFEDGVVSVLYDARHVENCELFRVASAEGCLVTREEGVYGINGTVMCSRMFGYFDGAVKIPGDYLRSPLGIEPELYKFNLSDASHIVVASAGFYAGGAIKVGDLGNLIKEAQTGSSSPAAHLVKEARRRGSQADVSVFVIDVSQFFATCRTVGEKASRIGSSSASSSAAAAAGGAGAPESGRRTRPRVG